MFPQPRVSVSSWSCWFPGRLCRSENREISEEEEERRSLKMSSLLTESFRLPRDSPLTQTATECTGFYRTIILIAWDSRARLFSGEIVNSPSEMKKMPKQETKCGHNCELKTLDKDRSGAGPENLTFLTCAVKWRHNSPSLLFCWLLRLGRRWLAGGHHHSVHWLNTQSSARTANRFGLTGSESDSADNTRAGKQTGWQADSVNINNIYYEQNINSEI